jgi:hypothetical protein
MKGTYNYIPETNHVSKVHSVADHLYLQFLLHVVLFRPLNMSCTVTLVGARGGAVVEALRYKPEGRGIDFSGFGGLGVCMLASGTQDRGFAPDRSRWIFPPGKNSQHAFFRKGK